MTFARRGCLVLMVLAIVPTVRAQNNELAGSVGRVFISNQGVSAIGTSVHFGAGTTFEVNYGRHLLGGGFTSLAIEVPVVVDPDVDLNFVQNSIPEGYSAIFVAPSVRANLFAGNAVSPWVSAGGGFAHFSESSQLVFGGPNPGRKGSTSGVLQVGAGFDLVLWKSLSFRAELRDFYSGVPQLNVGTGKTRQHNYFLGGGIVWHF